MSTALVEHGALTVTADQLDLVKRTVANGASDAELKLYLYDCQRQGVHPLDRLLHFTKRGGKYTPVTSIDLMRSRAADTGEYAGSDDAVFEYPSGAPTQMDGELPISARVTVWRIVQGQRCAFTATTRWTEYYPGDQAGTMWRKMPHTMLAKTAEGCALRKGFPRQLAGLYAVEELDQAGRSEPAGYTVTAPASPAYEMPPDVPARQQIEAHQRERNARTSAVNETVAAQVYAEKPNYEGVQAGLKGVPAVDAASVPAGLVRIVAVKPGSGKVAGELVTHTGETLAIFQQQVKAIAEQCCQDGVPVRLEIKTPESGKSYVKMVHPRGTEPMAVRMGANDIKPSDPVVCSNCGGAHESIVCDNDIPF